MSATGRHAPPATVASVPGKEADKMRQRFRELNASNQARLLETALCMIEGQRDSLLPPREREAKQLVDRITVCLDLIAEAPEPSAIGPRIWQDIVARGRVELAMLGIEYFATEQNGSPPIAAPRSARPSRPLTWSMAMRHVHAAEYGYRHAGMNSAIMRSEGTPMQATAAAEDFKRAFRRYVEAVDRQMMLPGTSKAARAWKVRHRKLDGGRAEWEAMIAGEQN